GIWKKLAQDLNPDSEDIIWFHAASLGEFEQGRPLMEKIRADKKERQKILVTFFSPSGYEVRKNAAFIDYAYYLPLDSPNHAQRFLSLVQPKMVIFIKYEFWYYYLKTVQDLGIPLILISAVFRSQQFFFKSRGKIFLELLKNYQQIFVQNQASLNLLVAKGLENVQLAPDTRYDRVYATAQKAQDIPLAQQFKQNELLFVIGSSWEADLEVILPVLNAFPDPLKIIIAPHEIKERGLKKIEQSYQHKSIRYSQASKEDLSKYQMLIIDNIGLLASLYQYGDLAYVGGAFKEGLHNILEPATFGLPIIFGKNHRAYPEARALIDLGTAFSIQDQDSFGEILKRLYQDPFLREEIQRKNLQFIGENRGGTEIIYTYIQGQK
ncbi:MAG: glycosyltransferase N-terminal domain-containing protein, partial [Bacteroidota bacterium]